MLILDAIRDFVAPIGRCIEDGEVFDGSLPDGVLQRTFMQHVLRPMLPARFGLFLGKAFSVDDAWSFDNRVLVHDALYSILLGQAVPCENVYAMAEVTPQLDMTQFENSVLAIASLKQLHRAKSTAHDVTPTHHLGMFGARYAQLSDDKLNPYLGYVFAQDADAPETLLGRMNSMIDEKLLKAEHTPDAIICFRNGWLIARETRTGELAVPRSSFAKFGIWRMGPDLMPLIYMLITVSLSQIQLRAPDLLRPLTSLTKQKHS